MNRMSPWLILILLVASGCQPKAQLLPPTATVRAVRIVDHSELGTRLTCEVELQNPNDTPLPLIRCDYTIALDGQTSKQFSDQPHRTLPAASRPPAPARPGHQVLQLPAVINTPADSLAGRAYTVRGRVIYELPGKFLKLFPEAIIAPPEVGFRGSGLVDSASAPSNRD